MKAHLIEGQKLDRSRNSMARSGGAKTVDSEAVLQDIVTNPESSPRRVSGELSISQSTIMTLSKAFGVAEL